MQFRWYMLLCMPENIRHACMHTRRLAETNANVHFTCMTGGGGGGVETEPQNQIHGRGHIEDWALHVMTRRFRRGTQSGFRLWIMSLGPILMEKISSEQFLMSATLTSWKIGRQGALRRPFGGFYSAPWSPTLWVSFSNTRWISFSWIGSGAEVVHRWILYTTVYGPRNKTIPTMSGKVCLKGPSRQIRFA